MFDVQDKAATRAAIEGLPTEWQQVDLLVNNAGLALGLEPAHKGRPEDWGADDRHQHQRPDPRSPGCCCRAWWRATAATSSISAPSQGPIPYPGGNVYGATKAFVKQFSLNLRADLAGTAVRVTNVEPGLWRHRVLQRALPRRRRQGGHRLSGVQAILPEDIANTVLWISEQPAHVNINSIEIMPVAQTFGPLHISRR